MTKLMDVNPFRKNVESTEMPQDVESRQSPLESVKRMRPRTGAGALALLLAVVLVWKVLASMGWLPTFTFPPVDSSKWQAVFLTNDQVYFGHLEEAGRDHVLLNEIYYLRVSQELQPPSQQPQTSINLVKLGDEIHGPEDSMYIPKSQIIFWENMRDNSAVVQVINQLKNPQQQQQ
jgi:hypothetical protein